MSIQELFKLHGINVPRFVTVDGTVVFDNVSTSAGGGYRHATLAGLPQLVGTFGRDRQLRCRSLP